MWTIFSPIFSFGEKKQTDPPGIRPRDGYVEQVVCKYSGPYLPKTACIFGLLCVKVSKILLFPSKDLVLVWEI